jgi:hypothetical protein
MLLTMSCNVFKSTHYSGINQTFLHIQYLKYISSILPSKLDESLYKKLKY